MVNQNSVLVSERGVEGMQDLCWYTGECMDVQARFADPRSSPAIPFLRHFPLAIERTIWQLCNPPLPPFAPTTSFPNLASVRENRRLSSLNTGVDWAHWGRLSWASTNSVLRPSASNPSRSNDDLNVQLNSWGIRVRRDGSEGSTGASPPPLPPLPSVIATATHTPLLLPHSLLISSSGIPVVTESVPAPRGEHTRFANGDFVEAP
ncbi:hypothetical protein BD410DRAFT_846978 [Rickenella mellea]|uniref:Uncharacterized protein n=1 Tax=Rickenella mellea TaxID=50990 RepID=A0A4Y7PF32_9AGAM|nr:hypothetical protein BD410DRAFT_846978 [Rickenella mellea]